MNPTTLRLDRDGPRLTITLNRPDAANGINPTLARELAEVAFDCAADRSLRVVVLTATGRFFSAGGDVKAMAGMGDDIGKGIKALADDLHRAISHFARMRAPLICAVNGVAAGAGMSMAACGDLVIAGQSAAFTMAYTKVGLSPDGSSSWTLPRLIGMRRTQELMLTNRTLQAEEALAWGLVTQVVDDAALPDAVDALVAQVLKGSPDSNATAKRLLLGSFDHGLETQMELEGQGIAACADGPNGREGVAAFVGKRAPEFSDPR